MARGCRRGCLTWPAAVVLLVVGAYAGFRWGDAIFPRLEQWMGDGSAAAAGPVPSPALAEETMNRVDALRRSGTSGERLSLGGPELSSVVRYSIPGGLPEGLGEPTVEVAGERVRFRGRLAVSALPDLPGMDEVLGLLPDTVSLEMEGALLPFDDGASAFHLRRVEASRIPIPRRFHAGILDALGRKERDGLPSDALAIPLPEGIRRAFVEGDQVILVSEG